MLVYVEMVQIYFFYKFNILFQGKEMPAKLYTVFVFMRHGVWLRAQLVNFEFSKNFRK